MRDTSPRQVRGLPVELHTLARNTTRALRKRDMGAMDGKARRRAPAPRVADDDDDGGETRRQDLLPECSGTYAPTMKAWCVHRRCAGRR